MSNEVEIKIHYLEGSPHLEKTDIGSWIDLYVYEDITLKAGQRKYISLGISMQLPKGYEALMVSRSSTFKRWGLLQTNSVAVIDNAYCGTDDIWMYPALATRDITIPKGTRICQFRIQKEQPGIKFIESDYLSSISRNGLGSTGT